MRIVLPGLIGGVFLVGAAVQPEFSEAEIAAIYIAALNGEVREDPPREVALNPRLMPPSGFNSTLGQIPASVVETLRAQGLFSEVCGEGPRRTGEPECISQRARVELRLSRPYPRDTSGVDVYVRRGSIRPANDTTTMHFPMGYTLRCRIVREQGRWVCRSCMATVIL